MAKYHSPPWTTWGSADRRVDPCAFLQAAELQEVCRLAAAAQAACQGLAPPACDSGHEPQATSASHSLPHGPPGESAGSPSVTMCVKVAIHPAGGHPAEAADCAPGAPAQPLQTQGSGDAAAVAPVDSSGAVFANAAGAEHPGDAAAAVRGVLGLLHACIQHMRVDSGQPCRVSSERVTATGSVSDGGDVGGNVATLRAQVQQLLSERDALLDHIMEQQVSMDRAFAAPSHGDHVVHCREGARTGSAIVPEGTHQSIYKASNCLATAYGMLSLRQIAAELTE